MIQHRIQHKEIKPQLVKYLTEATTKILLAIGWIDDRGLLGLLQKKAIEGLEIKLILVKDQKNESQAAEFQLLREKGAKIVWLDEAFREKLMDYKFGVIDSAIVLTGNYSWLGQNIEKEEMLYITESVSTLATGFEVEFDYLSILNQLSKNEPKPNNPIALLLKKLEVIKALLKIGDTEFIHLRLAELESFKKEKNVKQIYTTLKKESFEKALEMILEFTGYHDILRACNEPPIDKLRREIQLLEEEIAAASNEFNEIQKTLHKFSKQHSEILGDLLQKILLQTKIKAKIEAAQDEEKQEEYQEAKKDHEDYTRSYEFSKKQKLKVLTRLEQKELKKLYRQNSLKCHPDRVIEEFHDEAEEIFVELNEAYKANDLEKVKDIANQLKAGFMLFKSEGITELKKLKSTVNNLTQKYQGWMDKIEDLQKMPTFRTIDNIDDWEVYFNDTKEVLESQLDRLKGFNGEHGETESTTKKES